MKLYRKYQTRYIKFVDPKTTDDEKSAAILEIFMIFCNYMADHSPKFPIEVKITEEFDHHKWRAIADIFEDDNQ